MRPVVFLNILLKISLFVPWTSAWSDMRGREVRLVDVGIYNYTALSYLSYLSCIMEKKNW